MHSILRTLEENPRLTTIAIFCLALVVRLAVLLFDTSRLGIQQPGEAMNIAKSLFRDGEFAHAYGEGTGPTAHTTPLYPLLIVVILFIFGNDAPGHFALRLLTCGSASFIYAMLPKIAEVYGISKRAGVLGALIGAAIPYGKIETEGDFENVLTTCCFLAYVLLLNRVAAKCKISSLNFYGIGALAGGIALLGVSFVPAIICTTYDFFWKRKGGQRIYTIILLMFGFATVLMPWVIRNYITFRAFIPFRGNFWLEMAISNQADARATLEQNIKHKVFQKVHPFSNEKEREIYMKLGEVSYMSEKRREVISWITSHPLEFARLSFGRLVAFFFYQHPRPLLAVFTIGVFLLGIAGTVCYCRGSGENVGIFRLWWVVFTFCVIHLAIQVGARYRYPAHVLMLIPTGTFVELVWGQLRMRMSRS